MCWIKIWDIDQSLRFSGSGYLLTMVKTNSCDMQAVQNLVVSYVPGSQLKSDGGNELSFVLPLESSSSFEGLFSSLEMSSETLGISGFGVSQITLEDVFLR